MFLFILRIFSFKSIHSIFNQYTTSLKSILYIYICLIINIKIFYFGLYLFFLSFLLLMLLPYELIQIIFSYSDISTKLKFSKIFSNFNFQPTHLDLSKYILLSKLLELKYTHILVMQEIENLNMN